LTKLTWYNRRGELQGSIGGPTKIFNPVLSRDGRRLLAQVSDYGQRRIVLYDLANNTSRVATDTSGDHFNAVWAADGRSFFFSSNRTGIKHIYRRWLEGSTREEEVLTTGMDKNVESCSPDGRYLVFNQLDRRTSGTLWLLPLGGREPRPVLIGSGFRGSVSPNGRWIVYVSGGVNVTGMPGGTATAQTWRVGEGGDPQWSLDGRELFFLRNDDFMSVAVEQKGETVDFGLPHRLFTTRPGASARNHYTFGANRDRFVFDTPVVPTRADVLMLYTNWAR
jgi:Tol biopolymer transport system component